MKSRLVKYKVMRKAGEREHDKKGVARLSMYSGRGV